MNEAMKKLAVLEDGGHTTLSYEEVCSINWGFNAIRKPKDSKVAELARKIAKDGRVEVDIICNAIPLKGCIQIIDGQHRVKAFMRACENGFKGVLPIKARRLKTMEEVQSLAMNINNDWTAVNAKDYTDYIAGTNKDIAWMLSFAASKPLLNRNGNVKNRYASAVVFGMPLSKAKLTAGAIPKLTEDDKLFAESIYKDIEVFFKEYEFTSTAPWLEPFAIAWRNFKRDNMKKLEAVAMGDFAHALRTVAADVREAPKKCSYTEHLEKCFNRALKKAEKKASN